MKNTAEITSNAIYKVLVKETNKTCYAVPSDSNPGTFYVTCFDDASSNWLCTCTHGKYAAQSGRSANCKHAHAAQVSIVANKEASETDKIRAIAEQANAERQAAIAQHQAELDAAKVRPNYEVRGNLNGDRSFSLLK